MERPITDLKDKHKGQDIWVLAAGASMNYIDPSFFVGKIVIGVNEMYTKYKDVITYLVRKERELSEDAYKTGIPLIMSRKNCGGGADNASGRNWDRDFYIFEHSHNSGAGTPDLSCIGGDRIIVTWSTITSAIHIAAYMGAKNIIICGHDTGTLDGKLYFDKYWNGTLANGQYNSDSIHMDETLPGEVITQRGWMAKIASDTKLVKEKLKEVYGCNIHSLNPFINPRMEGHVFGV